MLRCNLETITNHYQEIEHLCKKFLLDLTFQAKFTTIKLFKLIKWLEVSG